MSPLWGDIITQFETRAEHLIHKQFLHVISLKVVTKSRFDDIYRELGERFNTITIYGVEK